MPLSGFWFLAVGRTLCTFYEFITLDQFRVSDAKADGDQELDILSYIEVGFPGGSQQKHVSYIPTNFNDTNVILILKK